MSKFASRTISSFVAALPLALAVAGSSVSAQTMEPHDPLVRPGMFYAGGNLGMMAQTKFKCGTVEICNRPLVGAKLFAGWRVTPGLAFEINRYYLGKSEKEDATPGAVGGQFATPTTLGVTERNSGVGFGINWEIETFRELTSHVRLGIARMENEVTLLDEDAGLVTQKSFKARPYIGVGLSMQLTQNLRFQSSVDWLRSPSNNHIYLFSTGISFEN
jgi:hypothetical protein